MAKSQFAAWFEDQYLDWQKAAGGRRTVTEFAALLGFGKVIVGQWMNDQRKPGYESACVIADKLNTMKVFDLLGFERPSEGWLRLWIRVREGDVSDGVVEKINRILDDEEKRRANEQQSGRTTPRAARVNLR